MVSDRVFFWLRVPRSCVLHRLACPSFARGNLRCAQCIVLVRSLLCCPLFHFTRRSLTLKLAYPSATSFSFSLFFALYLSLLLKRHTRCALALLSPPSDIRSDRTRLQSCHGPLSKFKKSTDRFSFSRSSPVFFLFKLKRVAVTSRKKARLTRE